MWKRRPSATKIVPAADRLLMKERFPGFRCSCKQHSTRVVWTGHLQPTDSSELYEVEITLIHGKPPRVQVLQPMLRKDAPHRYEDGRLCLYFPSDEQRHRWHPGQYIAKTIVPWTAEWLYFYELWIQTGTWLGPEAPHRANEEKRKE